MAENKFKLADIFAGIVIPLILVLLIFVFAVYLNVGGTYHILGADNLIAIILVSGFAQMIILGIPLVLGLLWNKWAGGAAGFIMGGLYYVASAGQYTSLYAVYSGGSVAYNFFGDVSMLFWTSLRCSHRLHGRRIKQRINKLQTTNHFWPYRICNSCQSSKHT